MRFLPPWWRWIRWAGVAVVLTGCGAFIREADKAQVEYNACFTRAALMSATVPGSTLQFSADEVAARLESLDSFLARNSLNCNDFRP